MPKMKLPEKLLPFLEKKKRFKVALGGRGGAKSMSFADMMLMLSQTRADKVGCFREFQNSIEDSVYSVLRREINRLELKGFRLTKNTIDHLSGGYFRFRGLARNIDSAKSMDGFTKFWVEEAQSVSEESLKILTPTLREADSEIWLSLNPMSSADPVSQRFIEPFRKELLRDGYYEDDLHLIVWINYYDNPFFPAALEQERKYDYDNLPRSLYDHVWLGHYNDSVEDSLIKSEWFDACVDAHIKLGFKPQGALIASHDPSDTGDDSKGFALRHGSVVIDVQEREIGDINEGGDWAIGLAIKHGVDIFSWDCDGMGVGLNRQITSAFYGKPTRISQFKGSEGPDTPEAIYESLGPGSVGSQKRIKDIFRNKRAQYYFELRDRVYRTYRAVVHGEYHDPEKMISFSSDIESLTSLRSEICRIPIRPSANGFFELFTKDAMKNKFKIASPNMTDAVMMTMRMPPLPAAPGTGRPKPIKPLGRR